MREFIIENLQGDGAVSLIQVLLNNGVAVLAALFIMFTYWITYAGVAYSRKFNISLGAITLTTTMVMGIISNNVALSLGMVGALSIIRFRTAVKDVRDATFIFWAIAVGIGCGVSQYVLVGVGSIFLMVFMLITRKTMTASQQLLVVQGTPQAQNQIDAAIMSHFAGKAHQIVKNVTEDGCELVYRVKENQLKKADAKNMLDISQRLMKLEGVKRVNLVEQQDDLSR